MTDFLTFQPNLPAGGLSLDSQSTYFDPSIRYVL